MHKALQSTLSVAALMLALYAAFGTNAQSDQPLELNARMPDVPSGRSVANRLKDRISVMDYCTPNQASVDITSCAQAAISAAKSSSNSYGGKKVYFPAQYSPYMLKGTLQIPAFVGIEGEGVQTSYISCQNEERDCVQIGSTEEMTRGQSLENIGIWGGGKTGGSGIKIVNAYSVRLERFDIQNMIRGIDIGGGTNNVIVRDGYIGINQPKSDFGIYWHAPADGSSRSDQLVLQNINIVGNFVSPQSVGIMWDGLAHTMSMQHVVILKMNYGMRIVNSQSSKKYFPSFLNASDFQCEGAKTRCLSIEAGADFKITTSDITNSYGVQGQGKADDYAVAIESDAAASIVRGVQISNSRIGLTSKGGLYNNARDTQISNVQFASTSMSEKAGYPVILNDSESQDLVMTNIRCEEFGGAARASHCLRNAAGVTGGIAQAIDARYVLTAAIDDQGSKSFTYTELVQPDKFTGMHVNNRVGATDGELVDKVWNQKTGADVTARRDLATNTANSYVIEALKDNNGHPYRQMSVGSAVSASLNDAPIHQFRSASGTEYAEVDSSGIKPGADGESTLGAPSKRWKAVFFHPTTVASLIAEIRCDASTEGTLASVTDANSAAFNAALSGGGSNHMMAYCNGSNWVVR